MGDGGLAPDWPIGKWALQAASTKTAGTAHVALAVRGGAAGLCIGTEYRAWNRSLKGAQQNHDQQSTQFPSTLALDRFSGLWKNNNVSKS